MLALLKEKESEVIVKLCEAVEFEKDLSWMGTGAFVNAIEELWQTACQIGYAHGQEDAESCASEASLDLSPPSVSVAATQTDAADIPATTPSMSAPQTPLNDSEIARLLLQTVPWDARKKGGRILQDCLQNLWEKASGIGEENLARAREEGFSEGKKAGFREGVASASQQAVTAFFETRLEKTLEAERVWGYDVGWKLCSEQLQSRASQASPIAPPRASPRSLSVAATQTDNLGITPTAPALLDWAEDAASLPICPPHSATSPSPPRDFSALHTGSLQPFASLQHRRRRSPRPATILQRTPRHSIRRPQQKSSAHVPSTRQTSPSYSHPPPSIRFPAATSNGPAVLNWDQDPRLRDLGQALRTLGWVRA
ncbi:hypothetical protein C8F04DRAFT_1086607 [Mycena alexandri]|uniref:Uncharacterized protein n=1 Tax=Mycena alexandri TaxID=1745969 RepID=A0AAD6RY42_9AGAR|nr:hypothetical protein C8F04DRAFT_1157211 [Mycena alexandri]KAJ7039380.1 hypothetical protein C8F04DRAFT_1086607 [Mycena alexandri]